ncbi:hypothetical protein KNV05_gp063 [Vibrio phage River4]|uniref:Uncharacterized protein n=1 Tax=Vibrio phage River4 TaxID=2736288 RepID=A0A6M9YZZ5_9CAUD|nr:hypothetical protein KNV05_gp063 [Vibrio phage River4]QKN84725.1 hypothetical protein RIVER4_63 [Vibrio phage River4]
MKNFECVITSTQPDKYGNVITKEALEKFVGQSKHVYNSFDFSKPPVGMVQHTEIKGDMLIGRGTICDEFLEINDAFFVAPSFLIIKEGEENGHSVYEELEVMDYGLVLDHSDECATPIKEIK